MTLGHTGKRTPNTIAAQPRRPRAHRFAASSSGCRSGRIAGRLPRPGDRLFLLTCLIGGDGEGSAERYGYSADHDEQRPYDHLGHLPHDAEPIGQASGSRLLTPRPLLALLLVAAVRLLDPAGMPREENSPIGASDPDERRAIDWRAPPLPT